MAEITVHKFGAISCLVNAVPIVDWFEGDDVIKILRAEALITPLVGADGRAIVSANSNKSATIELKLKPASPSNTVLAAFQLAFEKTLTPPPLPLLISDQSVRAGYSAAECIVMRPPPEIALGTNATVRTWTLFVANLSAFELQITAA